MILQKRIFMGIFLILILLSGCSNNTPKPTESKALVLELENEKSDPAVHVGKIDFYVK